MDTPQVPSNQPLSPPPASRDSRLPDHLTTQAPKPDPQAALATDDPLRYWFSTQPQFTARTFSDIWKTVWTQPKVVAYQDVLRDGNTTVRRSMTWVFSVWGIQLVGAFVRLILNFASLPDLSQYGFSPISMPITPYDIGNSMSDRLTCVAALLLIGAAVYLVLMVGIPHVTAVALGGRGRYEHTAFLYSAIHAPAVLIGALAEFAQYAPAAVESIAAQVVLGLSIYYIFMQVIAIKAVHNIGWFKSVVAVFSPVIIGAGIVCGFVLLSGVGGSTS